jgi:ribosomal protein S18 acetylase RimI-like enzyme
MEYIVVNSNLYREDFINLYQTCFKEPPYNENWSYETVAELWDDQKAGGIIVLCLTNNNVIGFATAYQASLKTTNDIDQFLSEIKEQDKLVPFDLETTIYVSELAVSSQYRRQGIAKLLIECLFAEFKKNEMIQYFMRADLTGAHSVPLFVKYFGGKQMDIIVTTTDTEAMIG